MGQQCSRVDAEWKVFELNRSWNAFNPLGLNFPDCGREVRTKRALKIRENHDLHWTWFSGRRRCLRLRHGGERNCQQDKESEDFHFFVPVAIWVGGWLGGGHERGRKFSSTIKSRVPGGRTCSVLRNLLKP